MAQLGHKAKATGEVAPIAVSLDQDKQALAGYAPRLGKDWTMLCEYKGYDSRAAKAYGITCVPQLFIIDARGKLRFGDNLSWLSDNAIEDLRVEAFWAKRRGTAPAVAEPAPLAEAPAAPAVTEVRWVFHLKSGGKLRVVSYEEADGKYVLKLPAGSSSVPKDQVERIAKADEK